MSQGWFRGSVGWGRFGGGNVTSRCHVYFAFYVHAFYATYCSQHSHHSSVPSLFPMAYPAASSSLDLAWLIFNIVSWFSSPSSRFFSFLFRSLSLSLLPLVVCCQSQLPRFMKCNMPPSSSFLSQGYGDWTSTFIYGAGSLSEHLFIYTHIHTQRQMFLIESWPCFELSAFQCCKMCGEILRNFVKIIKICLQLEIQHYRKIISYECEKKMWNLF